MFVGGNLHELETYAFHTRPKLATPKSTSSIRLPFATHCRYLKHLRKWLATERNHYLGRITGPPKEFYNASACTSCCWLLGGRHRNCQAGSGVNGAWSMQDSVTDTPSGQAEALCKHYSQLSGEYYALLSQYISCRWWFIAVALFL